MYREELFKAIANWINEAGSAVGKISATMTREEWIAQRILDWLSAGFKETIETLDASTRAIKGDLEKMGGWKNKKLEETMHQLIHIDDSIAELKAAFGEPDPSKATPQNTI